MRKFDWFIFRALAIGALLIMAPCVVHAQQTAKIGFINLGKVLSTSDAGQAEIDKINKMKDTKKRELQDKENELRKLQEELEKQRPILNATTREEKELSLQKKYRDFQDRVKDANDEINGRLQDMENRYIPEIMKIARSIGEKEKFTAIVDVANVIVVYYHKDNEITQQVIDEFNKVTKQKK